MWEDTNAGCQIVAVGFWKTSEDTVSDAHASIVDSQNVAPSLYTLGQ